MRIIIRDQYNTIIHYCQLIYLIYLVFSRQSRAARTASQINIMSLFHGGSSCAAVQISPARSRVFDTIRAPQNCFCGALFTGVIRCRRSLRSIVRTSCRACVCGFRICARRRRASHAGGGFYRRFSETSKRLICKQIMNYVDLFSFRYYCKLVYVISSFSFV